MCEFASCFCGGLICRVWVFLVIVALVVKVTTGVCVLFCSGQFTLARQGGCYGKELTTALLFSRVAASY